jgi:Icc-related predicted phosphoesterase
MRLKPRGREKRPTQRSWRLLYATDFHAGDVVLRKFLNAVSVYEANVAVIGGDLTGKRLAPIVAQAGSWRAEVLGREQTAADEDELKAIVRQIRGLGQYPVVVTAEEYAELLGDSDAVARRFEAEALLQVEEWLALAAERLEPLGVPLYVTGGNDDYFSIEAVLDNAGYAINADGKVLEIAPGVQMISCGYGNPTPWPCPRDISEEELGGRLEKMASQLSDPGRAIFNLHVPPFGSGLDVCAKLDTSVDPPRPLVGEEINAGSTAVRAVIERYQPAIGLHGHIHESGGITKIGPTVCINPGSEYGEGVLRSAVIDFAADGRPASWQLLTA